VPAGVYLAGGTVRNSQATIEALKGSDFWRYRWVLAACQLEAEQNYGFVNHDLFVNNSRNSHFGR